jgi:hypothetical protein
LNGCRFTTPIPGSGIEPENMESATKSIPTQMEPVHQKVHQAMRSFEFIL